MARKLKQSVYDSMPYLKESQNKRKLKQSVYETMPYLNRDDEDEDIAPVGGDKDSWFKSGGFSDGVDGVGDFFGDLGQTVAGTLGDVGLGILKGAGRFVEGVADLGTYGVAGVADLVGADDFADKAKKAARYSFVDDFAPIKTATDFVDGYSVLGNKADMVSEGLGQVGSIILTGGAAAAAGIGTAGVTALTTGLTGLSGMGSGMGSAYESGASDKDAFLYGLGAGAVEAGTELLFGGLGKAVKALGISRGIGGLDDIFAKKLSSTITKAFTNESVQKVAGNTIEAAIKAGGEGLEEVLSGLGSAVMKKLTYEKDEDLQKLIEDENLLEQFVVGSITSSIAQGADFVKANKSGRDFVTGYTNNEQKVIDKEVERRVAEQEKGGKKLTTKEVSAIEEQVKEDMEHGQLDIETIEEVLGGDDYKTFLYHTNNERRLKQELDELSDIKKSDLTTKQEERLAELKAMNLDDTSKRDELRKKLNDKVFPQVKGSKFEESYNQIEKKKQAFKADLSQYKGKQREAVERAVKSGVLNDTYRSHVLVDTLSKIEADKDISFDYTNNAKLKESGFAVEGYTVNGYANKNTGSVTLNVQSKKAWQSVVGHEITHVLEGTESYGALQEALYAYAESKGELESRRTMVSELYQDMADIDSELTADLVGDYLFTDKAFIDHLTGNRTLFQKVYDEIKYLWNVATGKEKTDIEKVKAEFDRAWKELSVKKADTKVDDAKEFEFLPDDPDAKEFEFLPDAESESDVQYSLSPEADADYMSAVERGDMETAQKMVDEAAKSVGYDTDAFHGTDGGDFTVFEWDKTQSTDGGFFGRGHYFTKYEGVAKQYGKRVVKAKLKLGKTFVWSEEVNSYNGKRPPEILSRNVVSRINMAKHFPDIFANKTMSYFEYDTKSGEYVDKTIRWSDLERIITDVGNNLTLRSYADGTYRWHTEGRFWEVPVGEAYSSEREAEDGRFFAAINALKEKYDGLLDGMSFDDQTTYTQGYGSEITEILRRNGYDSAMDTPEGGEIVVFESSQIKSADAVAKDDNGNVIPLSERFNEKDKDIRYSLSSIANTFYGDPNMTSVAFEESDYKQTDGYKNYVDKCLNNMRQTRVDFDETSARQEIDKQIEGIVRVAKAAKKAGYDIYDDPNRQDVADSKKRLLFSSLEPNSEYFTSSDISTICDKRKNFAEIYDDIVRAEEAKGVPKGKRFFDNVDNYFRLHNIMAQKGLTQPCRQCYVESMRKNLAPMANAFLRLVNETNPDNKSNDQLYQQSGKNKGQLKTSNAKLREQVLETLEAHPEYGMSASDLNVETLTTEDGLAQLKIQAPLIYEAFNSFYGQSKPKMPKSATPFRFGELTALLTDHNGKIKQSLVDKINSTGGFRLQSYSDFQIQNYTDVLQVIFEAGTMGLNGHAYTKVPAFLEATEGTNLKRNISIFMYKDGGEWKIDRNDSFPYELEEIYDIVNSDASGNTSIIAVSQNKEMSAWIMANDYVGQGIPFHKSGMKMGTVRDTDVRTDDGRIVKGYSGTIDHTKQQTEVWAKATADHKALTKVKNGINIYSFWDFDNADNLSKNELIEKNLKAYIDACEEAGYLPKFRDYVMNNDSVLRDVLRFSKELGFAAQDATIDDISFEYKGYRIPYGYYKFLGDFGMFKPDGTASPHDTLSLNDYDFDKAENFFADAEGLRRTEILQQFANGEERRKYRDSDLTAEELDAIVKQKRQEVVDDVIAPVQKSLSYEDEEYHFAGNYSTPLRELALGAPVRSDVAPTTEAPVTPAKPEVKTPIETAPAPEEHPLPEMGEDIIKTVKDRLNAKIENSEKQLEETELLRDWVKASYEHKIEKLQAQYDSKKNKDTKVAVGIQQRIANLKRVAADLDADIQKRISSIESRISSTTERLQNPTKRDILEVRYEKINNRLEADKASLAEDFAKRKAEAQEALADRTTYFSNKATDLYNEVRSMRKGVRVSPELGYILDNLDLGVENKAEAYKALRNALLNTKYRPDSLVDSNSAIERFVRDTLYEYYENDVADLNDMDSQYQQEVERLEADAEEQRESARKDEERVRRSTLHENIVNNVKATFSSSGFDFDDVLEKAKNLSTFATVDNTPQRVMEKALGYKEGGVLSDLTVNKVAQNETAGIKWLNSFTDRKNGLLAQISKQYRIKPGSKESAAAQMYAEGFYVNDNNEIIAYTDAELARDFPNVGVQNRIKGLAHDPRIRQIYDETLDAINASRTRNAYPEIQKLDNYFLHFRAMDDTFSRLGLPFNPNDIRAKDLPTDLNGVTADLKPGQPYFASAMHRTGKRTSFDLLGGLERYLTSAKNQIYHIDDIQTLRALRNYIADTYGQANGLEGIDVLSEEEAQERIEMVYNSHLSTFAKFLNEEANVLAGKTALIDRGLEGVIGRRGMTFLDTVNRQAGSNIVGFNISSSLTNFLPVAQTLAKTNKFDFLKAFAQTSSNKLASVFGKGDGFTENSPVAIRRKGADRFYRTPWQKAGDAGYVLMSAVDDISTELIARTKFNELTRKGMDEQTAHFETDKWVSRLLGDRSLGQQPQLYNSKTLGVLTKFQLEVRIQLDSQFYDTIQEAKVSSEHIQNGLARNAKIAAKVTSTFVQLAVAQHLFGKAFESVAGYNPAFDIVSTLATVFGFDDEEDSEDTVLDNIEQGFLDLLEDLPYTSTFTGGRIPIASALPVAELIKGKDSYGNEKSRLETLGEAAPYYVLPGGYGQIKKTAAGLGMFSDEHPVTGSYTDSGNLRFPVEDTPQNRAQAAIFGQYASDNAREYFDNGYAPLDEKQIQEYIDVDMPIGDYREYLGGLKGLAKTEEKIDYIAGLDLPVSKKNILANNATNRKEPIDLTNYGDFGSLEEFDFANNHPEKYALAKSVGGYSAYQKYSKSLRDIHEDKDADGKPISGSREEKVIQYINNLDADCYTKIILLKSEFPSDDSYNTEIIEYLNGRDDLTYEETVSILTELGFRVTADGQIYAD